MPPHERTIHKLCQDALTRHTAKSLFHVTSQRTGKGTGHDLGDGHGALAAICAFLASETTGVGEVTQEQARSSACVDSKTFEVALQVVRRVAPSSTRLDLKQVTFTSLVRQHAVREDSGVAMIEVAYALNESGALDETRLELASAVVQCAIFHWVCTKVFELDVPGFPVYKAQHELSSKSWKQASQLLDKHCSHMIEKLSAHAKTAATPSSRITRSQTRPQTDKSPLASPLGSRHPLVEITPRKGSVVRAMKRKAPTDLGEDESPSKRQKGSIYTQSPLGQDQNTHMPKATRGNAANVTPTRKGARGIAIYPQDKSDEDSDEDLTETIIVSKKPPRRPDTAAWEAQRPKPTDMYSTPTKASSSKIPTSSTGAESINSTPMTSTGMSDVFLDSPLKAGPPRSQLRARVRSPSAAAESAASSASEDDEMPRRRRRNLRAAFLDCDAYSWKPSARTKERLERARKLEALMIDKYGDPWDEL